MVYKIELKIPHAYKNKHVGQVFKTYGYCTFINEERKMLIHIIILSVEFS